MSPFLDAANHLIAAGVAEAYARPMPDPVIKPKPRVIMYGKAPGSRCVGDRPATIIPRPTSTPPAVATQRGPMRSCSRPAKTIIRANVPTANAYGQLACWAVHRYLPPSAAGSDSALATTLHVYRTPSARLIPSPAKVTVHPLVLMFISRHHPCPLRPAHTGAGARVMAPCWGLHAEMTTRRSQTGRGDGERDGGSGERRGQSPG